MLPNARPAVLLDRDGVLNLAIVRDGRPYSPSGPDEFVLMPGAREALDRLREAGYLLICVTNQPDVARGLQRREIVEALHRTLAAALPLDDVLVCYHDDADRCACRKPEPGLLLEAAARHAVDLGRSFMVGDRWRDIEAGRRAGCRTVLIDHGYAEREPVVPPDCRVRSLPEAAAWILRQPRRETSADSAVRRSPVKFVLRALCDLIPDGARMPILSGPLRGHWWHATRPFRAYMTGTYERHIQEALCRCTPEAGCVYNLGAHHGFHTMLAARLVGPDGCVVAFEPWCENADRLETNIHANRLRNVRIIRAAVSDSEGDAEFQVAGQSSAEGRLAPAGSNTRPGATVQTVTLDGVLTRGERVPDLLLIDVEGAESRVLAGADRLLREHSPILILSVHGEGQRLACTAHLGHHGYDVSPLREHVLLARKR